MIALSLVLSISISLSYIYGIRCVASGRSREGLKECGWRLDFVWFFG